METTPPQQRFFTSVDVSEEPDGFVLKLDGRPIKTPAGNRLVVPSLGLAEAMAKEWRALGEKIEFDKLPLTKLANTSIDRVTERKEEVIDDIINYASSDLICYRALSPETLVMKQSLAWDPVLIWVREQFHALFSVTEGVSYIEQRPLSLEVLRTSLDKYSPFHISGLHVMTSLTGSALLSIAHACDQLSLSETWDAAHIDEDWQEDHWGLDYDAGQRRARRFQEMEAASRFFHLS